MRKVRCLGCKHVFEVDLTGKSSVVCPMCGRKLRVLQLPSSTAGDSMFVDSARISPPDTANAPAEPDAPEVDDVEEPVTFCPKCSAKLYVDPRRYGGKRIKCPLCQERFLVPRQRTA